MFNSSSKFSINQGIKMDFDESIINHVVLSVEFTYHFELAELDEQYRVYHSTELPPEILCDIQNFEFSSKDISHVFCTTAHIAWMLSSPDADYEVGVLCKECKLHPKFQSLIGLNLLKQA